MKLRMRTILTFTISLLLLQVLFVAGFAITPPHAVTVGVPAQASWVRQSGDPQSISIGAFNVQGPLNGQNAQGAQLHAIDGSQNEGTITFEVSEDGTFTLAAIANGNVISNSATFKATTGSSLSSQVNKVVQPETTLSSTSSSTSQTTSTSSKIIIELSESFTSTSTTAPPAQLLTSTATETKQFSTTSSTTAKAIPFQTQSLGTFSQTSLTSSSTLPNHQSSPSDVPASSASSSGAAPSMEAMPTGQAELSSPRSKPRIGAIVGGILGALLSTIAIISLSWYCLRKRRAQHLRDREARPHPYLRSSRNIIPSPVEQSDSLSATESGTTVLSRARAESDVAEVGAGAGTYVETKPTDAALAKHAEFLKYKEDGTNIGVEMEEDISDQSWSSQRYSEGPPAYSSLSH